MRRRNRIRVKRLRYSLLRRFALIGVRAELARQFTAPDRDMSGAEVNNEILRLSVILKTLEGTLAEATPPTRTRSRKQKRSRRRNA